MAEYRMHTLDAQGRIDFDEAIIAENDAQALSRFRRLRPTAIKCELGKGNRLVASLNAHDSAA